jgi:hypothetical protein
MLCCPVTVYLKYAALSSYSEGGGQFVPPKHPYSPMGLHTVMYQQTAFFMVTEMRPSNLTYTLLHAIQTAEHIIFYYFLKPYDSFEHITLHDFKFSAF